MKILFAVPYIYEKKYSEFTRNKTGFGMMVNDIFKVVSKNDEVYLYSHVFTQGHDKILSHTKFETIVSTRIRDIKEAMQCFFQYKQDIKNRLKYVAYCVNKGLFRKYIIEMKPDIVHIHGIGMQTKVFIEVCEELRIPYTVTLHGLIGLNESVSAPNWDKKLERDFLLESYKKNIPVTVISSGMKKRIENEYLHGEATNIQVITNGTDIPKKLELSNFSIRERYNLPNDKKIAVVVGSLCERKNQIQIVDAVAKIPIEKRSNLVVFMCGVDLTKGQISKRIKELGVSDNIYLLGFVAHEDLSQLYQQADFNIVASKDEGFGLSIIESFMYGVPTVTFEDLDAIPNLYHKNAMIICSKRNTEDLALGIIEIMNTSWNKQWICQYASKFSLENMAKKYQNEYEQILKSWGAMPLSKTSN